MSGKGFPLNQPLLIDVEWCVYWDLWIYGFEESCCPCKILNVHPLLCLSCSFNVTAPSRLQSSAYPSWRDASYIRCKSFLLQRAESPRCKASNTVRCTSPTPWPYISATFGRVRKNTIRRHFNKLEPKQSMCETSTSMCQQQALIFIEWLLKFEAIWKEQEA